MEIWVEIVYFDGASIQYYYGTLDGSIQELIINKSKDDWVCLRRPRFLTEDGTEIEIFEDDIAGTEPYFYLRVGAIVRVAPIRPEITFWAEGIAPAKRP